MALLVLLVAGTACGADVDAAQPGASVAVEAAPPPTTAPPTGLAAIQRDVDALDHLYGEMARTLRARGVPDREFHEQLTATFVGDHRRQAIAWFGREAAAGFPEWRTVPLDPVTKVLEVVLDTPSCRKLRIASDASGFVTTPRGEPVPGWMWLESRSRDVRNPVGWAVAVNLPDGFTPKELPCT